MKRTLALFAALLLSMTSVLSCGESADETTAETAAADTAETAVETIDYTNRDEIPETDLAGAEITFLVREEVAYEFIGEESGELLSNAIYRREATVSERFNVKLGYKTAPGLWANATDYQDLVKSTVLAGDDVYSIVTGQSNIVMPLALQQMFLDVASPAYIDFDKPYWKSAYTDNVKINGKLYTLCGDYALTTLTMSNVLMFNKNLLEEYNLEVPYEAVKNGTWTFDKFLEIADHYVDLNGDGQNTADDLHGFITYNNYINPFLYAANVETTTLQSDGKRKIDFPSERAVNICDKVYAFCHSESYMDSIKLCGDQNTEEWALDRLSARQIFMTGATLSYVEYLRDMADDFGLVPYPKYEEAQENYRTSILRRYTISGLPTTSAKTSESMLVLEAMASIGYNEVIPTYYEIALKDKYARDTDTAEMLDIIASSSWFDFADAYYPNFASLSDFLSGYITGSQGVMSSYERISKKMDQTLADLYALFE